MFSKSHEQRTASDKGESDFALASRRATEKSGGKEMDGSARERKGVWEREMASECAGREEPNLLGCAARSRSALARKRFFPYTASLFARKRAAKLNWSEYVVSR
jgi:hypothetical protein